VLAGNINDYAAKAWAGLVGDYYKQRWEIFFEAVNAAIQTHDANPDWSTVNANILQWGRIWSSQNNLYPSQPKGEKLESGE
jgi:alpha-N-acetylglucosaminidase